VTTRHCPATPGGSATPPFGTEARHVLSAAAVGRVAFARQVHGAAVARAVGGGDVGEADVIVTTLAEQPLALVTADCLPILLYDPAAAVLVAAHVGWRGTVARAARAAVEGLVTLGGRPARALAAIGPSIGPCCYEVDRVVIDPLARTFPSIDRWVTDTGGGRWKLDLWAVNEDALTAAGVARSRVYNPRLCTSCRADLFHSYRRGSRGRLVTLAMLPPPAGR
jgi:YfiH family protein